MWVIDGDIIKAKQLSIIWQWFGYTAACRWGQIYYTPDDGFRDEIKRHELVHREQQRKQHKWITIGYPIFLFKYIGWWLRKGYKNNPFEREADALESVYQGWKQVTKDSWKDYR